MSQAKLQRMSPTQTSIHLTCEDCGLHQKISDAKGNNRHLRGFESQQMNFEPEQTPWFLCRLANIRTFFFVRGRRQGRQPLNPGAGPGPVALPEAFGGNRRLYTLAAPAADPPPVHPRPTIIVVIYSVFCVWCSKNIVFYRVLWPSPSPGFILATLKNHGFFMVLGLRKGSGTENWTSCRPWCQHRANIGQDVGYMGQHKAKIGQACANIGPTSAKMWATWADIRATWVNVRLR